MPDHANASVAAQPREMIGEGTFGKVKLGVHLLTGERVAVKVLEKKRMLQADEIEVRARRAPPAKLRARHLAHLTS